MTEQRIALDLEGVLAHPHAMVRDYTDRFDAEDLETFGFDDDDLEHFLDVTEYLWEQEWDFIPPTERNLGDKVDSLRQYATVDLVTNTPGPRERVEDWLDLHNIEVDNLVFPGPGYHKHQLDYDVYVDDNPYMPGDPGVEILYFYTQVYNEEFGNDHFLDIDDSSSILYYDASNDDPMVLTGEGDGRQTVVRVDSIEQVVFDIGHRRVRGATAI